MSDLELSVGAKDPDRPRLTLGRRLWSAVLPVALVVLLLGFATADHGVLSSANLLNIAQQTSYLALFAMAQTVVILTRGFDLALGPTVSMVSVGTALAIFQGLRISRPLKMLAWRADQIARGDLETRVEISSAARSKATQAITLEWTKCCRSPRTSQIPSSG